jgi:hypothetical protein
MSVFLLMFDSPLIARPSRGKFHARTVQRSATATAEYGRHPADHIPSTREDADERAGKALAPCGSGMRGNGRVDRLSRVPIAHAKVPILMRSSVEGLVPQPDGNEYMETVWLK